MRQQLEDNVTFARTVAMPAQGRKAQRMGSVVGQVETTLQRKGFIGGVLESRLAGSAQPGKLLGVWRLRLQRFIGPGQVLKR